MSKKVSKDRSPNMEDADALSEQDYDDMELLERLETLREDMEELGSPLWQNLCSGSKRCINDWMLNRKRDSDRSTD